jgi:hypothetical protein
MDPRLKQYLILLAIAGAAPLVAGKILGEDHQGLAHDLGSVGMAGTALSIPIGLLLFHYEVPVIWTAIGLTLMGVVIKMKMLPHEETAVAPSLAFA